MLSDPIILHSLFIIHLFLTVILIVAVELGSIRGEGWGVVGDEAGKIQVAAGDEVGMNLTRGKKSGKVGELSSEIHTFSTGTGDN